MKINAKTTFMLVCGTAAAVVIAGAGSLLASLPAAATAQFAKDTGKACGDCHTNPQAEARSRRSERSSRPMATSCRNRILGRHLEAPSSGPAPTMEFTAQMLGWREGEL